MPAQKKTAAEPEPSLGQVEADNYERLNAEPARPAAPAKKPESEE